MRMRGGEAPGVLVGVTLRPPELEAEYRSWFLRTDGRTAAVVAGTSRCDGRYDPRMPNAPRTAAIFDYDGTLIAGYDPLAALLPGVVVSLVIFVVGLFWSGLWAYESADGRSRKERLSAA